MNYGGIFLDNDVYVVNSLKKYLNYEMVVSYDTGTNKTVGSQVLIAHKNARLLKAHYDQYR
jgi:mannosyltransferase OCH1-like enzyme